MTIQIYEIETFETPIGLFEIVPMPTENIDDLMDFMEAYDKQVAFKKEEKEIINPENDKGKRQTKKPTKAELKKLEKDKKENIKFILTQLLPVADKIIDKGTQKADETKEFPLPMKYRNMKNRVDLALKIMNVTMGDTIPESGEPDPKVADPTEEKSSD